MKTVSRSYYFFVRTKKLSNIQTWLNTLFLETVQIVKYNYLWERYLCRKKLCRQNFWALRIDVESKIGHFRSTKIGTGH